MAAAYGRAVLLPFLAALAAFFVTAFCGASSLYGFAVTPQHLPAPEQVAAPKPTSFPSSLRGKKSESATTDPYVNSQLKFIAICAFTAVASVAASRSSAAASPRVGSVGAGAGRPVTVAPIAADVKGAARTLVGQGPLLLRRPLLSAGRGVTSSVATGRGARIVANVKVGRGMYARFRRYDMWMKFSQTFKGRRRNCHSIAKRAVFKALKQKYKSRRLFKRDRRKLWIMRVRANARLHGISYSKFICKLKEANINVNRKILAQLGVYDRAVFTTILEEAIPNWRQLKSDKDYYRKIKNVYTVEQIDNVMIPKIEKCVPEIYEDDCIRFNRKVHDWGVEYTIDQGDKKLWQSVLPKMPEIQNFELPDHWMGNANAEKELVPMDLIDRRPGEEGEHWWNFIEMVKQTRAEEAEKVARGEPAWPKKEGVSRDDWFKEEPQTWFD